MLVANSDLSSRSAIAELLTNLGYKVVVASNGEQALALIELGGIDLVVSAMVMDGMDGLELLWAMRDARLEMPVVAISSGADMIDEVYLRSAALYGAVKTYSWPLAQSLFIGGVQEILNSPAK